METNITRLRERPPVAERLLQPRDIDPLAVQKRSVTQPSHVAESRHAEPSQARIVLREHDRDQELNLRPRAASSSCTSKWATEFGGASTR